MKIPTKRALVLAGISLLAGELAAEPLPPKLGDWSPVVRAAAAKRAAQAGPAALPELQKALASDNPGLRHAATETVAMIARKTAPDSSREWKEITAKLIRMLGEDKDFWARCGAASALKVVRTPEAAPVLVKAAADSNPWVAAAAVDAISSLPVKFFDPRQYMATAVAALAAPRSETRGSALKMLEALGPDGKKAMPEVEASIGTYSQDSMFADRPRIDAIIWIARFDRKKAAALAGDVLKEDRWGSSGRYRRLLPFLQKLGADAKPAAAGLRAVAAKNTAKDKAHASKARQILSTLK